VEIRPPDVHDPPNIHEAGSDLNETINWICNSEIDGRRKTRYKYFASNDGRNRMKFKARRSAVAFADLRDSLFALELHDFFADETVEVSSTFV
jgi:hypothetical protein